MKNVLDFKQRQEYYYICQEGMKRNGGKLTIDRTSGSADYEETVKLKNFLTHQKLSDKIVNVRRGEEPHKGIAHWAESR